MVADRAAVYRDLRHAAMSLLDVAARARVAGARTCVFQLETVQGLAEVLTRVVVMLEAMGVTSGQPEVDGGGVRLPPEISSQIADVVASAQRQLDEIWRRVSGTRPTQQAEGPPAAENGS